MKKRSHRIYIQNPCSESWADMYSLQDGRHCEQCEKTVIDFSTFSDGELARFLETKPKNVCGRFTLDQLDCPLLLPIKPSKLHQMKLAGALATGLLLSGGPVVAQDSLPTKHPIETVEKREALSQNKPADTIEGYVMDAADTPLTGAAVAVYENGLLKTGVTSDAEGHFMIKIAPGTYELQCTYMGYEAITNTVVIPSTQQFFFKLKTTTLALPQATVTAQKESYIMGDFGYVASPTENKPHRPKMTSRFDSIPTDPVFNIFPNPFTSYLQVEVKLAQENTLLFHLYNASGQLLKSEAHNLAIGSQTITISLSGQHIPPGTYFLRISDEHGELKTKKLIKAIR
jgi:hypothetical protein